MSEATVSYDEVSTPANTSGVTDSGQLREALDFRVAQVIDLEAAKAELIGQINELQFEARNSVKKHVVKDAIVDLVNELTGLDVPDSLDSDQLEAVNEALEAVGIDTFKKTFRVSVEPTLQVTESVTIEVEAANFEEAVDQIESGDFDDDILSGLNLSYGSVQIGDYGSPTDEDD